MTTLKLTASLLLAALSCSPALAQTAPAQNTPAQTTPAKPADSMSAAMMKAAPTFHYSTEAGMNMMMQGGVVAITAAPGERLISRAVSGQKATLVYSGKNSAAIFAFYDSAIKAEGWKTTAMDGKMMDTMSKPGDTMAKPADTMAKPGDTMAKPADTMAKPGDTMAKPGDTMSKPADTMSKPGDTMNKPADAMAMKGGTHSATFAQGGHSIDLLVRESAGRVTVTFASK